MATATLITVPVYKINSNQIIDTTLYPYGMPVLFAGASLNVQPNSGTAVVQLMDGTTAFIYSRVRSSVTGDVIFYSNLTPASIASLANA